MFFWSLLIFLFGLYGTIGVLLKFFPKIVLEVLFLNRLCPPKSYLRLHLPEKVYGLPGAKSWRLLSSSRNSIGVWHIPPYDSHSELLHDAKKLVVYCHGNAFHRGFDHRLQLYKKLAKCGFHVVSFDYSGFADSTGYPSIAAAEKDSVSVLKWAIHQVGGDCTIVLWGHSLGTHICTRALLSYSSESPILPDCLILEAPFTTAVDASESFPISKFFLSIYPFFRHQLLSILRQHESHCPTNQMLPSVSVPILIMHAEDDQRVAFDLGVKLYEETTSNASASSRFIRFLHVDKRHGVKHYTARHSDVLSHVQEFLLDIKKLSPSDKKYEVLKI